jgi:hypothetical protein
VNHFYRLRSVLLGVILSFMVMGTAEVLFPQSLPETADQVRIAELERAAGKMGDVQTTVIHLQDEMAAIRENEDEAKWWYRGIGLALILAVLERILRTSGILRKTDGLGPVG